jgi:hypothetical protein
MNQAVKPVVFVIAALYFAVDELFWGIARPIANWLSRWRMLDRVRDWISRLRPYPALALFLVPLIVLEPVKPVATYLVATGQFMAGALVFAIGETLKLVLVERLFHINRDKLMQIPAFAWCYTRIRMVFAWLESFAIWQATRRRISEMKVFIREFIDEVFLDRMPIRSAQRRRSRELDRFGPPRRMGDHVRPLGRDS